MFTRSQTATVAFLVIILAACGCNPDPQPEALTPVPTTAPAEDATLAPALQTPSQGEGEQPAATEPAAPAEEATGNVANGEAVYGINCIACHAQDGTAGIIGPTLVGSKLAAQPDEYFRKVLVDGRPGTAMPAWGVILSDQEIEDLITFIRSKQ